MSFEHGNFSAVHEILSFHRQPHIQFSATEHQNLELNHQVKKEKSNSKLHENLLR